MRFPSRRWWLKATALAATVVMGYVALTFVQVWQASRRDTAQPADAIVVLGAAQYNGRPSPVLKARLDHALSLYRSGVAPLLVVTGGRQSGDRFTEATAGYNYLRQHGLDDGAIVKEVQGRTTWQSLQATLRILEERRLSEVVLVSDPSHAKRLGGAASELGLNASVSPAGSGTRWGALVRETAAVSLGRLIGYGRLDSYHR